MNILLVLLINKGNVDQKNVVLLMLVLGIVNALTILWSTVYLEYFVLDSTLEKSSINSRNLPYSNSKILGNSALQTVVGGYRDRC